jgi:hypothetical protein
MRSTTLNTIVLVCLLAIGCLASEVSGTDLQSFSWVGADRGLSELSDQATAVVVGTTAWDPIELDRVVMHVTMVGSIFGRGGTYGGAIVTATFVQPVDFSEVVFGSDTLAVHDCFYTIVTSSFSRSGRRVLSPIPTSEDVILVLSDHRRVVLALPDNEENRALILSAIANTE